MLQANVTVLRGPSVFGCTLRNSPWGTRITTSHFKASRPKVRGPTLSSVSDLLLHKEEIIAAGSRTRGRKGHGRGSHYSINIIFLLSLRTLGFLCSAVTHTSSSESWWDGYSAKYCIAPNLCGPKILWKRYKFTQMLLFVIKISWPRLVNPRRPLRIVLNFFRKKFSLLDV